MSVKWTALALTISTSLIFAGCSNPTASNKEETNKKEQTTKTENESAEKVESTPESTVQAYKDAVAELEKAKEGKEVDFDKVSKIYTEQLQELVKQRDAEFNEQIDSTLTTALTAGKSKEMDAIVVKQLFDKLMQKEFFQTMRHEFAEIDENWGNKEEVMEEYEEAQAFYKAVEGTVQKRDAAYGTKMEDAIAGGFNEMKAAIEKEDKLAFGLGKQVVDKTLMKTFYLATGAKPNGYATKAAEAAKTDEKEAKVAQAEGWAFYQSVYPYLQKNAPEDAEVILKQLDLETDVKSLDPEAVNKAFVRGFAKIVLHEYEESVENFGKEKGPIYAIEGALFISVIESDLKEMLGEKEFADITKNAQSYLEAVKANNKEEADKLLPQLEETLNKVVEQAK
ncbi:hypothetical protein KUV80_09110 [Fictibacillus nanhaiensis]|uniref:hypothetical protein n=1 Tax=Fictibacillus nanhaiensis TaxID=742169 RepID=UPI001C97BEAF|nr:hypothetical protein [Fictibacillus nanhaiensis]MBY6036812.1 hypothetical protein [Fictibacillus nanhaiensis]